MKEGVGGTFMIYVFLVFLAIYITFVAVAFNYARAFRVKNRVIDLIEQNEGITNYENTSGVMGEIESYLKEVSYNVMSNAGNSPSISVDDCPDFDEGDVNHYFNSNRGYCISRYNSTSSVDDISASYYKVTTFIRLEIPFLKLGFTIPVTGETRRIERIS